MKKQFLILFAFISVLALSQVPQRFNKVIVTGDITSPKFIKTGSNADSVLLGNGSARAISTIKTDTVNLSNRINSKATGTGTANGTNTGDETLTSIKTKLGAATPVSDGYLRYQDFAAFSDRVSNATHTGDATGSAALTLATVNSNVGTFNNITINAKGLATAGSNVSYEPSFSKNTAFNKNFGTTTGTVLEGRTFGTAANSAVGDFQPKITGLTTNYIPKWNGSTFVNSLISDDGSKVIIASSAPFVTFGKTGLLDWDFGNISGNNFNIRNTAISNTFQIEYATGNILIPSTTPSTSPTTGALVVNGGVGANHVRANNFYGSGSNLTGIQLPIALTTNGTSGAATFSGNVLNVPNYTQSTPYSYGAYSPTVTAIAGISSIGTNTSYFTNIGSIYHVSSLVGLITSVNVNETCTVQITLPSTPTTSTSISVMGVAGDAVQAYYNGSASGNTIRITFKSPVSSGSGTTVKITADYY